MKLPNDPIMLMSVLNTYLRDTYANADEINIFEKEHTKWLHQQQEEEQKAKTGIPGSCQVLRTEFGVCAPGGRRELWLPESGDR